MIGTALAQALAVVGITPGRVELWLGRDCGCRERKDRLDALGHWAARVLKGKKEQAHEFLERILSD